MRLLSRLAKSIPSDIGHILLFFVLTRTILVIIGVSSRVLLGPLITQGSGLAHASPHLWLDIWAVWDTSWYLNVARSGYSGVGNQLQQANFAFFPLFPVTVRLLGTIVRDYYVAGLIISNVCLIAACVYLYRLVRLDGDDGKVALNSVKYLFLFPTAFIFSGAFTESMYVALVIMCFYYARRRNWMVVGVLGYLVALTRVVGVFIALPLLFEYVRGSGFKRTSIRPSVAFLLLPPLGFLTFAGYNYYLTGDYLALYHNQNHWNSQFVNPFVQLFRRGIMGPELQANLPAWLIVAVLVVMIVYFRRIDFPYWLFALYSIIVPLATRQYFPSMPRYLLVIFPLYILLARLSKNQRFDQGATVALALLQGFMMVFWSSGFDLIM